MFEFLLKYVIDDCTNAALKGVNEGLWLREWQMILLMDNDYHNQSTQSIQFVIAIEMILCYSSFFFNCNHHSWFLLQRHISMKIDECKYQDVRRRNSLVALLIKSSRYRWMWKIYIGSKVTFTKLHERYDIISR